MTFRPFAKTTAAALAAALLVASAPAYAQHHHHHHHRHHHGGAALGAGIAGFAAGAILGGALSHRNYYGPSYGAYAAAPGAVAYCEQHYKSYDPASGTYLGYDGYRHPCP